MIYGLQKTKNIHKGCHVLHQKRKNSHIPAAGVKILPKRE